MVPNERIFDRGRRSRPSCSVLIAVHPPPFDSLIAHVLSGQTDLRVIRGSRRVSPARQAARVAPDVIVASTRLPGAVLADLERSSPASALILLTHTLAGPIPRGSAACLPEDAVVRRLLSVIRQARDLRRTAPPRPASASGLSRHLS